MIKKIITLSIVIDLKLNPYAVGAHLFKYCPVPGQTSRKTDFENTRTGTGTGKVLTLEPKFIHYKNLFKKYIWKPLLCKIKEPVFVSFYTKYKFRFHNIIVRFNICF